MGAQCLLNPELIQELTPWWAKPLNAWNACAAFSDTLNSLWQMDTAFCHEPALGQRVLPQNPQESFCKEEPLCGCSSQHILVPMGISQNRGTVLCFVELQPRTINPQGRVLGEILQRDVTAFLELLQWNKTRVKIPFSLVEAIRELNLLSFLFWL